MHVGCHSIDGYDFKLDAAGHLFEPVSSYLTIGCVCIAVSSWCRLGYSSKHGWFSKVQQATAFSTVLA